MLRDASGCSAHEVYIDEEQLQWFKGALQAAARRPVIVFSHAPPQGCGLTVIPVSPSPALLARAHAAKLKFSMASRIRSQQPNVAKACSWSVVGMRQIVAAASSNCPVQSVHVKNRCAFLNHSSNAQEFMQLVEQHPNIALWFSVSPKVAWKPFRSVVF